MGGAFIYVGERVALGLRYTGNAEYAGILMHALSFTTSQHVYG